MRDLGSKILNKPFLALLLLVSALASAPCQGKQFEAIRAVPYVGKVDYDAPFVFVIIRSETRFQSVMNEVRELIADGGDADLAAISEPYTVRYCNPKAYQQMKSDLKRAKRADTAAALRALYRRAFIAYEYEMDWNSEQPIAKRTSFVRERNFISKPFLDKDSEAIERYVEQLKSRDLKPDKIIGITTTVGASHFPVFDGTIRAGEAKIPYTDFARVLERQRL